MATPLGSFPTGIVAVTVFVAVLMIETVFFISKETETLLMAT